MCRLYNIYIFAQEFLIIYNMKTFRELVYMVLDEIKEVSDDSTYTEDHIIYLLGKYRAALLVQNYINIKKPIPESNYQNICIDLEKVDAIPGVPCAGQYMRSVQKVPNVMKIGVQRVYPTDYYQGEITLVTRERMKYVGHNKFLQNIIYASIGPDNYLYLTSNNPQFFNLESVKFSGIFEDIEDVSELQCESEGKQCDILDRTFPLEDSLINVLIQSVVKELLGATYRPADETNDARDDLSSIMTFIRRNMKNDLQKQIEE